SDQPPVSPVFTLADYPTVDPTAWADFEEHRKAIRKPMTDKAREKNAEVLAPLTAEQQRDSVDTTIRNRWTGLFPPKGGGAPQQKRPGKLARAMEVYRERTGA